MAEGAAAEALTAALREAFPIDAGPSGNLMATQPFLDAFGAILDVAANRIEAAGHAVAPMTSVDDDMLCHIVDDGLNRTRTSNLQNLFGLPYVHWDRELVEATIARLETCARFGRRKADALADHYPRILALKEARVAQVAARTASDDKVQEIEDRIAEIEALPLTAESYFETRGYANEFGRPSRDPAIREVMARYREILHDRQLASISVLSQFYADNLGFEDAAILADDWDGAAVMRNHCGIPATYRIDRLTNLEARLACEATVKAAVARRNELRCDAAVAPMIEAGAPIDEMLRVEDLDGSDAGAWRDTTLRKMICFAVEEGGTVTYETEGFSGSTHTFTVASDRREEAWTKVTLDRAPDGNGFVIDEVEHGAGGSLDDETLDLQLRCATRPWKRYCEGG